MKLRDFVLIPALLTPVVPAVIMGLKGYGWWYCIVWVAFYIFFGICEILSKKFRGKSISRDIADTPTPIFWSIVGSWLLLSLGLSLHWALMR